MLYFILLRLSLKYQDNSCFCFAIAAVKDLTLKSSKDMNIMIGETFMHLRAIVYLIITIHYITLPLSLSRFYSLILNV